MSDPKDAAIADLRLQVRLRDRELAIANDENDDLRRRLAQLKAQHGDAPIVADAPAPLGTMGYCSIAPIAPGKVVNVEPQAPAPVVDGRCAANTKAADERRRGGWEPAIVRYLREIGAPASATEIAEHAGCTTVSVYLSLRKYGDLVIGDGRRPERFTPRKPTGAAS